MGKYKWLSDVEKARYIAWRQDGVKIHIIDYKTYFQCVVSMVLGCRK